LLTSPLIIDTFSIFLTENSQLLCIINLEPFGLMHFSSFIISAGIVYGINLNNWESFELKFILYALKYFISNKLYF